MAGKKGAAGDDRFERVHSDPRFIRPQRQEGQVKLDERFAHLLKPGQGKGKSKKGQPALDRFGRKVKSGSPAETAHLRRIYRVDDDDKVASGSSDEGSDDSDDSEPAGPDYARGEALLESSSSEEESSDESGSESDDSATGSVVLGTRQALRDAKKRAAAVGSDDESSEDEDDAAAVTRKGDAEGLDARAYSALDKQATKQLAREKKHKDAVPLGDRTRRLAVVNMDWDNLRAVDLYAVFSSVVHPLASAASLTSKDESKGKGKGGAALKQTRGQCVRVRIYPSDFGRERMAQEDRYGPPTDIFKDDKEAGGSKSKKGKATEDSDDEDGPAGFQEDEGAEFDENKLRKYQLERLRYYYAIAEFDSEASASLVYDTIDGTEMEASANVFDLRFVPGDMEFPAYAQAPADAADAQEKSDGYRDEATEADLMGKYTGIDFKTDALRHSRVQLTWDQDDTQRTKITRRRVGEQELAEEDYKAYLASDASGSEDDEEAEAAPEPEQVKNKKGQRMRNLLLEGLDTSKPKKGRKELPGEGRDMDMEITFTPALSSKPSGEVAPITDVSTTKGATNDGEEKEETTREKYLRKQKEKREARMAKLVEARMAKESEQKPESDEELPPELAGEDGATGLGHFSIQDIVRAEKDKTRAAKLRGKAKKKAAARAQAADEAEGKIQPGFHVNPEDDRFAALYTDHQYALDPSHASFRKTEAMQTLLETADKKRRHHEPEAAPHEAQRDDDPAALVKRLEQRASGAPRPSKKQKQKA